MFPIKLLAIGIMVTALGSPVVAQTPAKPVAATPPAEENEKPQPLPKYLAIVTLLAQPGDQDPASDGMQALVPEKAVQLFKWSGLSGGKVFKCGVTPDSKTPAQLNDLAAMLDCATSDTVGLGDRIDAVKELVKVIGTDAAKKANAYPRVLAGKDDAIQVVVLHSAIATVSKIEKCPPLFIKSGKVATTFKEDGRSSRIATDLETLARVALVLGTGRTVDATCTNEPDKTDVKPIVWLTSKVYTLTLGRANLSVSASITGAPSGLVARSLDDEQLKVYQEKEADLRRAKAAAASLEALKKAAQDADKAAATIKCASPIPINEPPIVRLTCTLLNSTLGNAIRVAAATALGELEDLMAIRPLSEVANANNSPDAVKAAAMASLAKLKFAGAATAATGGPPAQTQGTAGLKTAMTLATGSGEHWYLAVDVPVSNSVTVETDASGSVTGVADPGVFYISAGYTVGDVLTTYKNPLRNLSFKVLIKASTKPLDSYGVAIGLRGGYLKKYGIDFDLVSPFVAYLWTRVVSPTDGAPAPARSREGQIFGGLSLNLDKALGWLKQ